MTKKCLVCGKLFKKERSMINHKRHHSKPLTEESRRKISEANEGEKNGMWKGDNVSYDVLHAWIKRHKPKPKFCEKCEVKLSFDLANISQEYKRDVNDYEWLCRSCHMKSDGRINNLKQYKND